MILNYSEIPIPSYSGVSLDLSMYHVLCCVGGAELEDTSTTSKCISKCSLDFVLHSLAIPLPCNNLFDENLPQQQSILF